MSNKLKNFNIPDHIINCEANHRGGTLKVDVSELFPDVEDAVMGAYQNYLGGGLRGAVVGASMFDPDELNKADQKLFEELKEKIKQYFHALTNDVRLAMNDEWNTLSYQKNQALPVSAY